MLEVERIVTGSLEANCYIAVGPGGALVIDPGEDAERIVARLQVCGEPPRAILLTHAHDDHIGAAAELNERTGAPVHLHLADERVMRRANLYRSVIRGEQPIRTPAVDVDLAGATALHAGEIEVEVIHTPGHTPGSICFAVGDDLFTGDTILADRAGRTDLPEGDREALSSSLSRLAAGCRSTMTLRPGHGEPSTLGSALSCAGASVASG